MNETAPLIRVDWGCYRVAQTALISYGYIMCRGICMWNDNTVGLAHLFPNRDPTNQIRDMSVKIPNSKGIIWQIDTFYKWDLEEIAATYGVEVILSALEELKFDAQQKIVCPRARDAHIDYKNRKLKLSCEELTIFESPLM